MDPGQARPDSDPEDHHGSHFIVETRPDPDLITQVLAGDDEAFAPLVHRYRDRFARFATRMLGSRDDAEDVLQSAFLRAYRNLATCREPSRFAPWLMQIVVNECRTFAVRDARREARLVRDLAVVDGAESAESGTSFAREEILRAIDDLPADQREAFLLKHVEELEYEEISELTGASVSALKMRTKRACARLRVLLEGANHAGTTT